MGGICQVVQARLKKLFSRSTFDEIKEPLSLNRRILWTVPLVLSFRILADIPALKVDEERLNQLLADNPFLGVLDLFAGGEVLKHFSLVAAGIFPYLVALVIAQGATWLVPSLRTLRRQGEEGKKRIECIATLLSVPLAFIFALAISQFLSRQTGLFPGHIHWFTSATFFPSLWIVCLITGGSLLSTLVTHLITNRGVGTGESVILLTGASLALTKRAGQMLSESPDVTSAIVRLALILGGALLLVVLIAPLVKAERRIPVVYPRGPSASRRVPGVQSQIPLPLTSGGILPVSAAIGLLALLHLAQTFLESHFGGTLGAIGKAIGAWLTPASDWFWVALAFLIVLFTYVCNFILIGPKSSDEDSLAEQLKKQGAFTPGLRPGAATDAYFARTVARISLLGGVGMACLAAGVPYLIFRLTQQDVLVAVLSLIVVVKTVTELEFYYFAYLKRDHYEGLIPRRKK